MVHFMHIGLPLLVGLLFNKKVSATCTINFALDTYTPSNCAADDSDDGYYVSNNKVVSYTNGATPSVVSHAGYYLLAPSKTQMVYVSEPSAVPGAATAITSLKPGYYKNGNGDYYACSTSNGSAVKDNGCVNIKENLVDACTEENTGKLMSRGLCLGVYKVGESEKTPILDFIATTLTGEDYTNEKGKKRYLVKHKPSQENDGRVFNFDKGGDGSLGSNYYVIKHDYYSIELDTTATLTFDENTYGSEVLVCADAEKGLLIDRLDDFCSETGSGKYYKCESGKCKSYLQSNSEVQESNDEPCEFIKLVTGDTVATYQGKCIVGANYLTSSNEIVTLENVSSTGKIIIPEDVSGVYSFTIANAITVDGYYINGDPNTKYYYPLIYCENNECSLKKPVGLGYYITGNESADATIIKCTSESSCESYTHVSSCSATGDIRIDANHKVYLCERSSGSGTYLTFFADATAEGAKDMDKEQLLLNVSPNKFPGVTIGGNYAVQMNRKAGSKIGTILLNTEKKTNCGDADDNEVIKASDGKFYYCANKIAVPMKKKIEGGAKFAIQKDSKYILIQIEDNGFTEITDNDLATHLGYYVDRTSGATGIVECVKKTEPSVSYECEAKSDYYGEYNAVYENSEVNFPTSATDSTELTAEIIVCGSSKCQVPSINEYDQYVIDDKPLKKFFTNAKKELVTCNGLSCSTKDTTTVNAGKIIEGIYINGGKDLSLIRCTENKEENVLKSVTCETFDATTYSYYVNHKDSISKLIQCNKEECDEINGYGISGISIKNYLNGDTSENKIIECDSINGCLEVKNAANYYIDNSKGGMNLIYCVSGGSCTNTEGVNRGVYISGDGKNNRLIRCNTTKCEIVPDPTNAANPYLISNTESTKFFLNGDTTGDRIITDIKKEVEKEDGTGTETIYKWGLPETKLAKANSIFINGNGSGNDNAIIHCTSENSCSEITPSDDDKYIDIINSKIISKSVTWALGSSIEGTYVFDKTNGKISVAGETGSLVICKNDNGYSCDVKSDGDHFYIDTNSSNNLIINNNNIFSVVYKDNLDKGYYINSESDIISCSDTGCTKTGVIQATLCTNDIKGKITSNGLLCLSKVSAEEIYTAPLLEAKRYIVNGFAGINGYSLVKVADNKIVKITDQSNNGYYLVKKNERSLITNNDEGELYSCTSGACTQPLSSTLPANDPVKNYPNSDSSSAATIICQREVVDSTAQTPSYYNKCTLKTKSDVEVYCLNNSKLYSCINECTNAGKSDSTDCYALTPKAGLYLPYEKNGLISCSTTCSLLSNSNVNSGYYVSQDNSNPLINCNKSNGSIRCAYETANSEVKPKYYTGGNTKKLIKCSSNICKEIDATEDNALPTLPIFYISGEKDKALIKSFGTGSGFKLESLSKPEEGYYRKLENDGLIKCSSSNGNIKCEEISAPNIGYYKNFGTQEIYNKDYLIKCTATNKCEYPVPAVNGRYYVNGETKKLLYCDNYKCEAENGNGWYRSGDYFIINCTNSECISYAIENVRKGYYMNADSRTFNKPLIDVSSTATLKNSYKTGWYLNADASDSKKIIECVVGQTVPVCETKALVNSCSSANNGKFVDDNGEIKWCNGSNKVKLAETGKKLLNKFDSKVFSWITENKGIAVFEVFDNKVEQTSIDGYYYDDENEILYNCSNKKSKLCTEETDIKPGYYVNYSESNKIIKCTGNKQCRTLENSEVNSCINSNVKVNVGSVKLCLNNNSSNDANDIAELNMNGISENTYALENRNYNFPRANNVAQFRYFLADVSSYYIKFNEVIKEVSICGQANKEESAEKVCLKDNKLVYVKDLITTTNLNGSVDIPINTNEKYEKPEYDADTNSGYYIYRYEKRISTTGATVDNNILNTVFIKKTEKSVDYKLECKIGGICIRRAKAAEPIICYELDNGILKSKRRNEDKSSEVKDKIIPGTYIKCNNSDNTSGINCYYDENDNIKCKDYTFVGFSLTTGGLLKHTASNVIGSKKYNKLVPIQNSNSLSKRDVNSDNNGYAISELSATSFRDIEFMEENIFLFGKNDANRAYLRITNEILDETDEAGVMGYMCNSKGKCISIDNSGNKKYFLNSIQNGKPENAVVVCGDVKETGSDKRCRFINAEDGLIFENYAANGVNDALITCTNSGCSTTSVGSNVKLPDCKFYLSGSDQVVYVDENNNCVNADNELPLLKDQHCIFNGKIYKNNEGCIEQEYNGSIVFDATLRKLEVGSIKEKHLGALMYNCPKNGKCYVTYGYITNKGSKYFSKCSNGVGCEYLSVDELKESCNVAGEGALIVNSEGYFNICTGKTQKKDRGSYLININISNNFPETDFGDKILVTYDGNIFSMVITDGYVILNNNNINQSNVDQDMTKTDKFTMIKCTSSNKRCENVDELESGYYYSASNEEMVITCLPNSTNGNMECSTDVDGYATNKITNVTPNVSFSTSNDNNNYYEVESGFPGSNYPVIVESSKYNIKVMKTDNYILLNTFENRLAGKSETRDIKDLYSCKKSIGRCDKVETIEDGYYISGRAGYDAIKCNKGSCEMIESLGKSCNSVGDLIISSNVYKFCASKNGKANAIELSENIGKLLDLSGASKLSFPNDKTYVIIYSNAVIGTGYVDSSNSSQAPTGITVCKNDKCIVESTSKELGQDEYCLYNGSIYGNTSDGTNYKCSKQFTEGINVEVFYGSKLLGSTSKADEIKQKGTQMFYCNSGSCRITTGYKKFGNVGSYKCEYGGCSDLKTSVTDKGDMVKSGAKIKTDNSSSGITYSSTTGSRTYHYISGYNKFPGAETYKSFLVEVGDTYMVPYVGNGYYLIDSSGNFLATDPKESAEQSGNTTYGSLYICENVNCILQTSSDIGQNVFYINAASESSNKAIIKCGYGKCSVADEKNIVFDANVSSCEFSGMLVRTTSEPDGNDKVTFGAYKLCTARNGAPVSIDTDKLKYYMITIMKNDTFADIAYPNEEKYEKSQRKVLIEVSNVKVSEYEKEGYILYNPTANEIVSNIDDSKNTYVLYYCSKTKLTDSKESYECEQQTTIDNGWYFNSIFGDRRIIRCIDNVCGIIDAKESSKCLQSGSIIYNNGFKICQTLKKQIDVSDVVNDDDKYEIMMNVSLNTEFPGLKTNNTDILVSLKPNKITQVKMKTNVIVDEKDNTVIDIMGKSGILYECIEDGNCVKNVIPNDNWYMKKNETGYNNELIYCSSRRCYLYNEENTTGYKDLKPYFRVSSNIGKPLIQCVKHEKQNEDKSYTQIDKAECLEREFSEGWFINASSGKPLIKCTTESACKESSTEGDGFYINAGADSKYSFDAYSKNSYSRIIKCNGEACEEYKEISEACNNGGEIVVSGTSYKLCKEKGKTLDFTKNGGYEVINNEGSYPGSSGLLVVKVSNTEIVNVDEGYYYIDNNMYYCNGSCSIINGDDKDGIYLYDEISSMLYIASCSNGECSWSDNKSIKGNVFLDDSNKLITNESVAVRKIYECTENSSKKNICKDVLSDNELGYFFNNENKDINDVKKVALYRCVDDSCELEENDDIKKCSYLTYKSNYCYIGYNDEPYSEDYSGGVTEPVINAGLICRGTADKTDDQKYYFAINEINTGIDNVNCVQTDSSSGYYKVNGKLYYQNAYSVRVIKTYTTVVDGMNTIAVIKDGKTTSEYNAIFREDNGNMITCSEGKCELGKLNSCTYSYKTGKCTASTNINQGQICISSENKIYLALERISSSRGNCISNDTRWGYSLGSNTVTPDYSEAGLYNVEKYVDTYHYVDNKIYKFERNGDIYVMSDGVYLIDKANKIVTIKSKVDISKDSQFTMYVCTSTGCKIKNTCNSNSEYEYIYDNGQIIQCDSKTTTISYYSNEGYFINGPWENLIKCINGKCVVDDNDTGMEGYYLDSGNKEKVIKCIRSGDKFKCELEDPVYCTYSSKEGTCIGNVDLLRNSYCYHIVKDKNGKVTEAGKILYVENFIRANEKGKCIANNGDDEIYYHYRKSKFLGNDERDEIIKFSKGAIVSVYEKNLGYYIITTNERKGLGINGSTPLNKSRLYECKASGCVEVRDPVEKRIYINKASMKKMVYYSNKYWTVLENRCTLSTENPGQCTLPSAGAKKGNFMYIFEKGDQSPKIYALNVDVNTVSTVIGNEFNSEIDISKYQYVSEVSGMYLFDESKQFFDIVKEDGYYIFNYEGYKHNLDPYRSTVNATIASVDEKVIIYNNGGWTYGFSSFREGYYWNKADRKNEGIIVEIMEVPLKLTPEENDDEEGMRKRDIVDDQVKVIEKRENDEVVKVKKVKALINGCVSSKKNICNPKLDGQKYVLGESCVVTDGDNVGLHLVIGNVDKGTSIKNCMRYDSEKTYYYIDNSIEFISEPHKKLIVEIDKNEIKPFVKGYDRYMGYFVYDKAESKLLSNTASTLINSYYCGWEYDTYPEDHENAGENNPETQRYECNTFDTQSKYYVGKGQNNEGMNAVLSVKDKTKWSVESKKGYYFFNDEYTPAKVNTDESGKKTGDEVYYSKSIGMQSSMRYGTYLNAAMDNEVIVKYDSKKGKYVETEYKVCTPSSETCNTKANSDVNKDLNTGDICLSSTSSKKSLYIVIVDDSDENNKKTYCYTGSEKLKYRFVSNKLYKLDGLSVQEVEQGYYVLNDKWEEFSATYPEVPNVVIYCDGSKCEKKTSIEINSEVIFNEAATGNNKLLRFYSNGKFVNVFKPGYYLVNERSEVTKNSGYGDYVHRYYLTEDGTLQDIPSEFGYSNIYVNNAKEGLLTRYYSEFTDSKAKYNSKTQGVEYDGYVNRDENENVYVVIDSILYRQLPYSFEIVEDGLYAIKNGRAFESNEPTSLSNGSEIWYSVNGSHRSDKLSTVIQNGYAINKAMKKESIIYYNKSTQKWRIVNDTGIYFFFEDGNSISLTDRRIDRVMEVVDGDTIDITEDENRYGFYKFEDLMIESNSADNWEDAVIAVGTVETDSTGRVCNSYESVEIINSDKFCYNSTLGVCMPKMAIGNEVNGESNCVFSDGVESYYFLFGEDLFSVSDHSLKNIIKDGLYITGKNKKVFEEELESKANAYACNSGKCSVEDGLSTGYYLNMANGGLDEPVIVYYNENSKTWRKVTVDGYYFFNKKGYAVRDGDEINSAYAITEGGKEVDSIKEMNVKGIYINQSSGDENVVVEFTTKWEKAKSVPSCKISEDGKVTTKVQMKPGEICLDGKQMILIKASKSETVEESKKKRDEEYTYEGVTATGDEIKYNYDSDSESLVKIEDGKIISMDITGYVIIDDEKSLPVTSVEAVSASAYKCSKGKCKVVDSVESGKRYVNAIADELPLVVYEDSGKWKVESESGYYFFGSDLVNMKENTIVVYAIEVENNGALEQRDISKDMELGYYFDKASSESIILSNDEEFWDKAAKVHECNVTVIEGGNNCRTLKSTKITSLDAGDYCYDPELDKLYILTAAADEENETVVNCVAGSNESPLYLTSEKVSIINKKSVGTKLVKLTDDSIKTVTPGIYILNVNGTLIEDNDNGEIEASIYNCDESGCDKVTMEDDVMFLSESGEIFIIDKEEEKEILRKVEDEGLYFFNNEGKACSSSTDVVTTIIKITAEEGVIQINEIDINDMDIGGYINNANDNVIAVYDGEEWSIEGKECKINEEKQSCESDDIDMEVGNYCIIDGVINIVSEVDEENSTAKCIPGSDEIPLYYKKEDGMINIIKKSSVSVINEEGYYAINVNTMEALKSETPVASIFVKCNEDGECTDVEPEYASSYLNKAVTNGNIVKFADGEVDEAITSEKACIVEGNICSAVEDGTIESGEMCVADGGLYLVKDNNECVKAEKYVIRLQFINNKIYKLVEDAVVQVFDGYYFMNGDNRIIGSIDDYAKPDTIGYMCSINGDCYVIDPGDVRYYKDYATEVDGEFKVIKFDPKKKSRRDEEGSSGYEPITEAGIYRLDDGSYVDCFIETNEEVSCKNVESTGAKVTIDNEIILCSINNSKEVECVQATEGGYYLIDDVLMECEANENGDSLECVEVKKEGYFLADGEAELYECNKKADEDEVNASSFNMSGVNALYEEGETDTIEEVTGDEVEIMIKREDSGEAENNEDNENMEEENMNDEEGENNDEENAVPGDEENEDEEGNDLIEEVDVTCKIKECIEGAKVVSGGENSVELYVCKKITKEEDDDQINENEDTEEEEEEDKFKWFVNAETKCDTKNFIKKSDNYYLCDTEKKDISPENIEKPNEDHTSTEKTTKTSEEKPTTTTEDIPTTTSSTSSTTKSTSSEGEKTTPATTPIVKTTTTTTTTTTAQTKTFTSTKATQTTTTTQSGALSMRSLPSISLYIILFIIAFIIQF